MSQEKVKNGISTGSKILIGILVTILIAWGTWVSTQCNLVATNKSLIQEKAANLRTDVDKNMAAITSEASERKAQNSKQNTVLHSRITNAGLEFRQELRDLESDTKEELHDLKIIFMDTWKVMLQQQKQVVQKTRPSQYNGR